MKKYILTISFLFTFLLSSCIIEHDNEPICEEFNGVVNENCTNISAVINSSTNSESITLSFFYGGKNYDVSVEDSDSLLQETLYFEGTRIEFVSAGVYNNPSVKVGFTSIDRENKIISGTFSFTSDSYTDTSFGTREVEGIEGKFENVICTILYSN